MEPGASKKGRWRNYPYQVEIFDAITDPECSQMTIKFCSQLLGKSAILTGLVAWLIDQQPTSIVHVFPTVDNATNFAKSRLNPLIASTPCLSRVIDDNKLTRGTVRTGYGTQTVLRKTFPGGWYLAGGSNSPAQLRAHTAKITIFDETSAFATDVEGEGDPLLLVRQRSARFPDAFSISASTPTISGSCRISADFEQSDQRYWHVCCIHCKHEFILQWQHLVWPKDRDVNGHVTKHKIEEAYIMCPRCEKHITDEQRIEMVKAGRWIATNPSVKGHRGYDGNCFLTLGQHKRGFRSWLHYFAARFFEAEKLGAAGRKTFQNLLLSQAWEPVEEKPPDYQLLYNRRELYHEDEEGLVLPEKVLFLVCGADVQQDRIEAEIMGVGRLGEHYGVQYKVFRGNTETPAIFNELDAWLQIPFRHPSGHKLAVACTCVDSGNLPQQIYQYVYRAAPRAVYACKGVRGFEANWVTRSTGRRQRLFLIKVDGAKAQLYSRLNITEFGPGYQHTPSNDSLGYDATWCQQLTSEHLRTTVSSGRVVKFFAKPSSGIRNEALDARVLALAAVEILNPNYDAVERSLRKPPLNDWRKPAADEPSPEQPVVPQSPPPKVNLPLRPTPPVRPRSGWTKIY
jgi:phage terminase large subunit GpA-like protein